METVYWVTGILMGVSLGVGLALRLTVELIMRSNCIGDYTGDSEDFGFGVEIIRTKDETNRKKAEMLYGSSEVKLQRRRNEVIRDAQLLKMQEREQKTTQQQ